MGEIKEDLVNSSIVNLEGLEVREYQIKIAENCVDRNS